MQKIALISFTMCIYPNLHAWWCIAVFYKNTKKVYFIKVARASLSSVWRRLFSLIIVHVLDMIHTYIYVLEHVQLKQPDQGHHTLFISNGRCLQIAARANVFWLFFFILCTDVLLISGFFLLSWPGYIDIFTAMLCWLINPNPAFTSTCIV